MNTDVTWLLQTFRPFRRHIALLLGVSLIYALLEALKPIVFQAVMDDLVKGQYNVPSTVEWMLLYVATAFPALFIQRRLVMRYAYDLEYKAFQHALKLDSAYFGVENSTEIANNVENGIAAAQDLLSAIGSGRLLVLVPLSVIAAWYIGSYSLSALAALVLTMALFLVCGKWVGQLTATLTEAARKLEVKFSRIVRESIQHHTTLRTFRTEADTFKSAFVHRDRWLSLQDKLTTLYSVFTFTAQGANISASIVVLFFFGPQLHDGKITVGTFIMLFTLASRVVQPAVYLGDMYADAKSDLARIVPFRKFMLEEPAVVEASDATPLAGINDAVRFENVSLVYPGQTTPALEDINLEIKVGEVMAVLGKTGSGKSSLARLLLRLHDPSTGRVTFDGQSVAVVSFDSLYAHIGYLAQNVPMFSGTVADNLMLGRDYPKRDLVEALETASAQFVFRHPDGLLRDVGELGINLSGGEKQRIAIARLLLHKRNPHLVVLDEATAALDTITEGSIVRALNETHVGRTWFVIAHRLASVEAADRIVIMDEGRIVALGTPQELRTNCSLYRELCGELAA